MAIDAAGGLLDFRTPPCQSIADVKISLARAHRDFAAWKGLPVAEQVIMEKTCSPGCD